MDFWINIYKHYDKYLYSKKIYILKNISDKNIFHDGIQHELIDFIFTLMILKLIII